MKPRLSTSVKWTPFPTEFSEKIIQVMSENFADQAKTGEFTVEGRIYPQEILLRVGYVEQGRLKQDNFEASMDYSMQTKEQTAQKTIFACLDAIGSSFDELFNSGDELELPRQWEAFDFEGDIVWMQYSTVNTKLEDEADRLLNSVDDKNLVREDGDSDDALSRAIVDTELAHDVQKEIRKGPKIQ
jgi:hypothetical protein